MTDVSGIALLSDLMRHASDQDPRPLFAPDRLRFVLQTLPDPEAAGRLRDAVAGIIGSDAFDLEPLFDEPAEVAEFFVLAPRGLDRTLSEDRLYDIADDLRRRLDLVSCEPDIGAPVFADPEETPVLTPEGAIVEATCWAKGEAPKDKLWALKATGVPHAWQLAPGQGRGIVIAQPDTGIADHAEFSDTVIDRSRTANILEGGTDPRDPLRPGMANPGHGTATGSVVASGPGGRIVGSAPRASLVPIRCIDDVRIFNGSSVA
ncbi:MAG: S8/S53 family peptidase, partial [Gemmobacter sp.]